jgi:hypothetical protein
VSRRRAERGRPAAAVLAGGMLGWRERPTDKVACDHGVSYDQPCPACRERWLAMVPT